MAKTDERMAYEFLKFYHLDDQALVEGWRRNDEAIADNQQLAGDK